MVRGLETTDRSRIEEIVTSSTNFNPEEKRTAIELMDEALGKGEASGYLFALTEDRKKSPAVQGYACYGPAPLTEGVYDLYWIVVDPSAQGLGYGRRLIEYVEADARRRGGRMILIETSSQESYKGTLRFYQRAGYHQVARIKNFYRIGDDKLIFAKDLL